MEKPITKYKTTKQAEDAIVKKMNELLELCQIYKVPMFTSVALQNNEEETVYKNIMFGGKIHDIILKEDQIQNHILVANGFKAVPRREEILVSFSPHK